MVPHQPWARDVLGRTYLSLHLPDCFCRAGLAQVWSLAGGSQWHNLHLRPEEEIALEPVGVLCGVGEFYLVPAFMGALYGSERSVLSK